MTPRGLPNHEQRKEITMSLTELQEKRGRLVTQAREALEEIKKNTDESRAAELEARHDKIMGEFDTLEATIKREERQAEIEARAEEARAKMRPIPGDGQTRGQNDDGKIEYRDVFHKMLREGGDISALTPEERNVLRSGAQEVRVQSTTTTAGGYTVPTTMLPMIVKSMAAWGPMYDDNICTVLNTTSGEQIDIPTVDDTAGATLMVKTAEGTGLTDDGGADVTFGTKALNAYAYDTEFIRWSYQLNSDSILNVEQLLAELLGERIGRKANIELTNGDGNGDPNGIVFGSTLGVTAASATALTADEIIDLQHSVNPAYRASPKTRFMFSDGTLKVIRKLKDGEGRYLWDAGDFSKGVAGTILGQPYSVNQAMSSVATTVKSIVYGDFGKYFVRKVGGPMIGVMRERFWPNLGIAGIVRIDGEFADTAAIKHLVHP
jgi:HK97 family phage major capsid protein